MLKYISLILLSFSALFGADHRNSVYVIDVKGDSALRTKTKITPLVPSTFHLINRSTLQSEPQSETALLLSNGVGMTLYDATVLEVPQYEQTELVHINDDFAREPSISTSHFKLVSGNANICTSKLSAGSTFKIQIPRGSLNIKGGSFYISNSDSNVTTVYAIKGDLTYTDSNGKFTGVGASQKLVLGDTVQLMDIAPNELAPIADRVATACMAKSTVLFFTDTTEETLSEGKLLRPIKPENIISPYKL